MGAVVEGCMDPLAVNYDDRANYNGNTWCISKVEGCMMPPSEIATHYALSGREHERDKLALNYNPLATVHVAAMCTVYHEGCMDATAMNYVPMATVEATCYYRKSGCLNRKAINYGCAAKGLALCDPAVTLVTEHFPTLCTFYYPPPSP